MNCQYIELRLKLTDFYERNFNEPKNTIVSCSNYKLVFSHPVSLFGALKVISELKK